MDRIPLHPTHADIENPYSYREPIYQKTKIMIIMGILMDFSCHDTVSD